MLPWHCMLIRIKSLTWLAYGADWVHWPSVINSFDRPSSWDSALREEEFEMNKWNATLKYLCTHLNYSVILMYSATPPTQTPKGNKKSVEVKCGLCPVNN